jgi:hypothetical protein
MAEGDREDETRSDREPVTGAEREELDQVPSDPDRAAILARRQRFIAVALSGLTGAGACDRAFPQPCLEVSHPPTATAAATSPPQAAPAVSSAPAPAPAVSSAPALAPAVSSAPAPAPRPCLKVALERPEPAPRPCLKVLRQEDAKDSDDK